MWSMWSQVSRNKFKIKKIIRYIILLAVVIIFINVDNHQVMINYKEVAERMAERQRHLMIKCSQTGLDGPKYNASTWEFLVNRQFHVIWCNVFKAASTSWMYNFNLMANYTEEFLNRTNKVPLQLARYRYPRPLLEEIEEAQVDSITFMIVRHPLVRLASAYKDKIVDARRRTPHYKLRLKIIKMYRKELSTEESIGGRRRTQRRRRLSTDHKNAVDEKPIPKEKYPVFEEFVSYILDEVKANRPLDMHWTPYTAFCTPCKIHFDLILKFETVEEDQKYLIHLAHLEGILKVQWRNKGRINQKYVNSLYSRLSRLQLDGLYQLYKYDFQLFNYSIDSYYDLENTKKSND